MGRNVRLVPALLMLVLFVGCPGSFVDNDDVADDDDDAVDDDDTGDDDDSDPNCLGTWGLRDIATGLCWQNPADTSYMDWQQATEYCAELEVGGALDWRVPDIGELVTLLRGCADGATDSSTTNSTCTMLPQGCVPADICVDHESCGECEYYEGPASDGCYWKSGLAGSCTNAYWSSSTAGGNGVNPWFVTFGNGAVGGGGPPSSAFLVRCVREGGL
ncbi:MAG: DUF1566 domain-containing protein [Deltaproteobacteria bacterium]|nr:DUF1566 domain-containing protein [Deltaproteobacteria bacterium]